MRVLAIDDNFLCMEYVISEFEKVGYEVKYEKYNFKGKRIDEKFDIFFENIIKKNKYDIVFTFNYYPIISNNCNKYNVKYVSWVYDSPHVSLYSFTIINPCNYIFIFDKEMYLELKNGGIDTVYYMPLAVDTDIIDKFIVTDEIYKKYKADVSFVGSLYNEKHCLYKRFDKLPPYVKGYLDALVKCQSNIYGYFLLEEHLTPEIVKEIQKVVPYEHNKDGIETPEYVYANYFMARKVTEIERHNVIKEVSDKFNMKLYTGGDTSVFPKVHNMGNVDYYNEMPYVFKCSKINLNISLKSINSGIPLRVLDIMAAKGFVISNYQSELLDYFVPGEDLVIYDNIQDLIEKINYYLHHEEERKVIAENGYKKVKKFFNYNVKLKEILNIVNKSN